MSATIPKKLFALDEVKIGQKCIQLCLTLKDTPGVMAKIANILADANINIKSSSSFYIPEKEGVGVWSLFVDMAKATKSVGQIEMDLRKIDAVLDVRYEEPKPVPFDAIHFPVFHATTRAVIMPIGTYWALWDRFEKILHPSGLAALLYDAGKKTGEHVASRMKKMFNLDGKNLILALGQSSRATGWGLAEACNVDFEQKSATMIVKDCFEALAWRKKPYKVCHWTRGYCAGFMSVVFEKPVEAVEVKCLATGDEHCEFQVRAKT